MLHTSRALLSEAHLHCAEVIPLPCKTGQGPLRHVCVHADKRSLLVGSRAIPGPGSGSGPGSSGMALTTSGPVSALACSAGWLLVLFFSVGSAHSKQLVKPESFCGVTKIAKAIV